MFSSEFGGQIAWLLPSVLILAAGLLWVGRRAPRTDGVRASVIMWGSWVLVTGLVFSFMAGIIHPYYAVALAPGIAGLAGLGGVLLWQHRRQPAAALLLAAAVAAAASMGFALLGTTSAYGPWLRWFVLAAGLAGAAGVLFGRYLSFRVMQRTTAVLAVAASLAGPLAFSLSTAAAVHSGAIVSAGPATSAGGFRPGGPAAAGQGNPLRNGANINGPGGTSRQAGGMGGLLGATSPSAQLVTALRSDASRYTWAAAVVGSNNAAGYQLATQLPVMPVGGFNGTDPSPSLGGFQDLVAQGKIHYFIAGGTMRSTSGSDAASQIARWVAATFPAQSSGGTTVYALVS
jgi:4-amino-4-deoxy-L-arabinose transferase-like glycosyltransferase